MFNLFNTTTTVLYQVSELCLVTVKVYDVLGNEIATLINEEKPAGSYEVQFNAASHSGNVRNLPSGIYFYKLNAGSLQKQIRLFCWNKEVLDIQEV
ncbi:MAG: T9SS type A sorting domain-containing protein [Ignavibacteriaceae bacterium]